MNIIDLSQRLDLKNRFIGTYLKYAPKRLKTPVEKYINNRLVLVPVDQLKIVFSKAIEHLSKNGPLGDYLEFGVFRGDSLACMYKELEDSGNTKVRLFGFDSFEGLPDIADTADKSLPWQPGQFKMPLEETKKRLDRAGVDYNRVFLIKGWYSNTLNKNTIDKYKMRKASLIMIDCDLYSSAKQALEFCAPLIQDQAIIFFDDWGAGENLDQKNLGEKKAFEEFLKANPKLKEQEYGEYYPTGDKNKSVAKIFLITRE